MNIKINMRYKEDREIIDESLLVNDQEQRKALSCKWGTKLLNALT